MKKKIATKVLNFCLDNLARQDALALYRIKDEVWIPYLMNDAVECYIVLNKTRLTGEYVKNPGQGAEAKAFEDGEKRAVVVKDRGGHVYTVWYSGDALFASDCFQYHQIMHYWRKGAPHLRRLVGIVSAVYDKEYFIGRYVCNDVEHELAKLIFFAPFRHYSPTERSLDDMYPDKRCGAEVMYRVALDAGDLAYAGLVVKYMNRPSNMLRRLLTIMLGSPLHARVYYRIDQLVREASANYANRCYEDRQELSNLLQRMAAEKLLENKGFTGTYPNYSKGQTKVTIYEEQPFTKMEDRALEFKVYLLKEQSSPFFVKRTIDRIVYPKKIENLLNETR